MDGELDKILKEKFTNDIRVGYTTFNGTTLPTSYRRCEKEIENFEVRDDDVWVSSFPKSGTTWTLEMVWLVANDLDYEKAKQNLGDRFPFLEVCAILDFNNLKGIRENYEPLDCVANSAKFVREMEGRRFIKTHLPWDLLPLQIRNNSKRPKIIYIMRNPKDVCVSYYHHSKLLEGYTGNLDEFHKLFLADKLDYTPYWHNLKSFWSHRDDPNVLILTYESMKRDLPAVIRRVATFFSKTYTDEQIETLANHLSFDSMKKNDAVNFDQLVHELDKWKCFERKEPTGAFMRSGTVGSFKKDMSEKMVKEIDQWAAVNNSGTGITF